MQDGGSLDQRSLDSARLAAKVRRQLGGKFPHQLRFAAATVDLPNPNAAGMRAYLGGS
jgi:hypothetical protein